MSRFWTVQCGYAAYYSNVVTVEADTLEQALPLAIEAAQQSADWKAIDHSGDTFVEAAAAGEAVDPWRATCESRLPVPFAHTEAALWTAQQPGYRAMLAALRTIAAGREVKRVDHTEIEDVEDAMAIAEAALWTAQQPGYRAMLAALRTIAAGREVKRDDHTEIEDVEDPMAIAEAALDVYETDLRGASALSGTGP